MIEQNKLGIQGFVKATLITDDKELVVYDGKNAILANSLVIHTRCIGGQNFHLDQMIALKASVPLATVAITDITFPAPPPGESHIKMVATFSKTSFDDTLDELRLSSAGGGDYSSLPGLSILKDSASELKVSWTIQISNNP